MVKYFWKKTSYEQNGSASTLWVTLFVAESEKTVHGLKYYIKQSSLI